MSYNGTYVSTGTVARLNQNSLTVAETTSDPSGTPGATVPFGILVRSTYDGFTTPGSSGSTLNLQNFATGSVEGTGPLDRERHEFRRQRR